QNKVQQTIEELENLSSDYTIQVNPRPINYFYLLDGLRERILEKEGRFYINNTKLEYSKEEFLGILEKYPERFSPNVVKRPLYQEVILPNLCYIGGGGELAYWLELKSLFDSFKVPFPILLLRNSVLLVSEKQAKKLDKLGIKIEDLFLKQSSFINKRIREISNIEIDLSEQKLFLKDHFEVMYKLAEQTDKSFYGAVKAQEVKQLKGIDKLEKRLLKAQKRKLKDEVIRISELQDQLFPGRSLQERTMNFSEFYMEKGKDLIPFLLKELKPLDMSFSVLRF
ncbi:bacillithiol biosynthesis protein BshC, partial [Eudoraea sp.]|uniref:bacillithiol biosynthesis protein BshC n=1 Tax=Eudoraea sp. TaxID=1979955 RepID=UPI003C730688